MILDLLYNELVMSLPYTAMSPLPNSHPQIALTSPAIGLYCCFHQVVRPPLTTGVLNYSIGLPPYPQVFHIVKVCVCVCVCVCVYVCVPMPTHCTITRFGFRAGRIDGVECGLFSNHAPLGQTILRVGRASI